MRKKGTFLITIGLLLVAAALFLSGYNIWESKRAEKISNEAVEEITGTIDTLKTENEESTENTGKSDIPDYVLFPEKEMPVIEVDGERYIGMLDVPSLNLTLPVMADEWSYAKLKKAPCRYSGSVYLDNMVIAGHNYRSHFSRLKTLKNDTEIQFTDAKGNVFYYKIGWIEVLEADEVEAMKKDGDWDLTLFTCTYGGGERYTIRCIRQEK